MLFRSWWLGNEWTNLFPVCNYCNDKKADNFITKNPLQKKKNLAVAPIENGILNRQKCSANHANLVDEKPQLLHPEIDNPEDFLEFTTKGKAIQKAETIVNRNIQQTLDLLNLSTNEEERLDKIGKRKDYFDKNILNFLEYAPNDFQDTDLRLSFFTFFKELINWTDIKSQYSLLGIEMLNKFEEFFLVNKDETVRKIVVQAFELFINENINK